MSEKNTLQNKRDGQSAHPKNRAKKLLFNAFKKTTQIYNFGGVTFHTKFHLICWHQFWQNGSF